MTVWAICYITLNNLQEDSKCLFSLLCATLCHRYWGVDRKMLKLLPHLAKEEGKKEISDKWNLSPSIYSFSNSSCHSTVLLRAKCYLVEQR